MLWPLLLFVAADPDLSAAARQEVARQECRGRANANADVVVCGQRKLLNRYQVTDPKAPWDPSAGVDSALRERTRWIENGDTGIGACGAVGPGGWTGCLHKTQKAARQQYKGW